MCWQQCYPKMLNSPLPQPLILTLVQKLPCQLPVGQGASETTVKMWVKKNLPLTNSAVKANALCICTTRHFSSFNRVLCTESGRKLCQVSLSQAIKATQDWSTELKPHVQPLTCCRVLEIQIRPTYQRREFLSVSFCSSSNKNSAYHWSSIWRLMEGMEPKA